MANERHLVRNVTFLEAPGTNLADTVVIVSNEEGRGFVEDKIRSLFGKTVPERVLATYQDLSYKKIESIDTSVNGRIVEVVIVGAGPKNMASRSSMEKLGGYIFDNIRNKNACIRIINNIETVGMEAASAYIASGLVLKSWTFDKYKTNKQKDKVKSVECLTSYVGINKSVYEGLSFVTDGVFSVRNMVTEPSSAMTPLQMTEEAMKLKKLGVKVSVLDSEDLEKLGMESLLAVARGSEQSAYVVAMEYSPEKETAPVVLVGKGVTFDAGGLCLKPARDMWQMKMDMTGAAVVIGTLRTIALKKMRANVVGVIGLAENVISGQAQKPGDVIVSMSKKTIEVDNTDAEGRLILADILWYASEKFGPQILIDFATLTGAIQVALGHEYAGLFSNSNELVEQLLTSSDQVGEKLWRLPLHPSFKEDIKSDIADIKNTGCGRGAGSITAAMFLEEFVPAGTAWAHIDIAATSWDNKNRALSQKGATGFCVRLMDDLITRYYSKPKGD